MSYKFDYVCVVFDATCFFETCMSDWNVTFVLQTETCKCEVVFDKHATQCNVSIERVRISGCRTKISEASGGGCTFDHQRRGRVPQPLCGLLVLLLVKGLVFWAGERHGLAWLDVWGAGGGGGGGGAVHKVDYCWWGCNDALWKFKFVGFSHHVGKSLFFCLWDWGPVTVRHAAPVAPACQVPFGISVTD